MVMNKIMHWMKAAAPKECSGYGSIEFDPKTQKFTVVDATVLNDGVSGAYTEISPEKMGKLMNKLRHSNSTRWWWHSHVNMGAFWSGTDKDTIIELGQKGWQVATVFNLRRELRTAMCTRVEVLGNPHDMFVDEIPTTIMHSIPKELMDQWDKEFEEIKTPAPVKSIYPPSSYSYPPYYRSGAVTPMSGAIRTRSTGGLSDHEWDESGFARIDGETVYNPARDWEITYQECVEEMQGMEPGEVAALMQYDQMFSNIYLKNFGGFP